MRFTVKATPGNLPQIIDQRVADAPRVTEQALGELGAVGASTAASLAAAGPTGGFRSGMAYRVEPSGDGAAVVLGSSDPAAAPIDRGRRAGKMPPPERIADLYGIPLTEAFPIARKIGEQGTAGQRVFERTRTALRARVQALDLARRIGRLG